MMIEEVLPGAPRTSRTRAVTRVSPIGKAISEPTPAAVQNWARELDITKAGSCEALRVHASPVEPR